MTKPTNEQTRSLPKNWLLIKEEVDGRLSVLKDVIKSLPEELPTKSNKAAIAATDVFVEKAQLMLTSRARNFMWAGIGTAFVAVAILAVAAYQLFFLSLSTMLDGNKIDNYVVTLLLVKSSTAGALVVGIAVLLSNLSKALLHEATVLYSRRHALRFGRLFVYVRNGNVTLGELQQAFRWNDEFSTAFKNINTEIKTPISKAMEIPGELVRAASDTIKSKTGRNQQGDAN